MTEAQLPFAEDFVKPRAYQGLADTLHHTGECGASRRGKSLGLVAGCQMNDGLIKEPIPQTRFESEFGDGAKNAFKIIDRCLEIIGRGTGGS